MKELIICTYSVADHLYIVRQEVRVLLYISRENVASDVYRIQFVRFFGLLSQLLLRTVVLLMCCWEVLPIKFPLHLSLGWRSFTVILSDH